MEGGTCMKTKRIFSTELAYLLGLLTLALGTAFMVAADFGVSMVVAPPYLLYLKIARHLPWFTFGMSQYLFQTILLLGMVAALRRFRLTYLFALPASLLYGLFLDGCTLFLRLFPCTGMAARVIFYALGLVICAFGVALLFHAYFTPEVYELIVLEVSRKWGLAAHHCKTVYDCISCLVGVALSFAFFGAGRFVGVRLGTVLCALVNGPLIGLCSRGLERHWQFRDCLPYRRVFQGQTAEQK